MPTLDQLRSLLESSPDDAFILYGIAMEHAKLGDHEEALLYFNRALAADPANPYHYFHKARSLETLGELSLARDTLALGLAHAEAGNNAQAINEITAYLEQLSE